MRRHLTTTIVCIVAVATLAAAADSKIPPRPEDLEFGTIKWDIPDADGLRFELANGTPVYAMPDNEFPLVNIAVYFRGGRYLVSEGQEGLHSLAGEVWRTGGAGDLSAAELDEELDFLAASLSVNISDITGSVGLNVLTKDLEAAMALMMDVLTRPRFQEDRFAKAQDDLIQAMKTRNDNTASIEAREWNRLIYGEDFFLNRIPTKASVEAVTPAQARAFATSLVRADNIIVAVSGDFEKENITALLDKTIGTLPKLDQPLSPPRDPTTHLSPVCISLTRRM